MPRISVAEFIHDVATELVGGEPIAGALEHALPVGRTGGIAVTVGQDSEGVIGKPRTKCGFRSALDYVEGTLRHPPRMGSRRSPSLVGAPAPR